MATTSLLVEPSATLVQTLQHVYEALPHDARRARFDVVVHRIQEAAADSIFYRDAQKQLAKEVHYFFERHGFASDADKWASQGMTPQMYARGMDMVTEVLVKRAIAYAKSDRLHLSWLQPEWSRPMLHEPVAFIPRSFQQGVPIEEMCANDMYVGTIGIHEILDGMRHCAVVDDRTDLTPVQTRLPLTKRIALAGQTMMMQDAPQRFVKAAYDVCAGQLVPLHADVVDMSGYEPASPVMLDAYVSSDGKHGRGMQAAASFLCAVAGLPMMGAIEVGPAQGDSCTRHFPVKLWTPQRQRM